MNLLNAHPNDVHVTSTLPQRSALYDLPSPEQSKARARPRQKGARMASLATLFKHPDIQWEGIWVRLYGKETIAEVVQLDATWYGAAGNEPLTVVLVRDPCREHRKRHYSTLSRGHRPGGD